MYGSRSDYCVYKRGVGFMNGSDDYDKFFHVVKNGPKKRVTITTTDRIVSIMFVIIIYIAIVPCYINEPFIH